MWKMNKVNMLLVAIPVLVAISISIFFSMIQDHSLNNYRENGTIRVGYAVEAPYAFLKPGGEVTGESPEVARQIAARLGIGKIEWVQTEFGSLISGLQSGRFDLIAAGMFITPERAEQVAFSEPTFRVQQGLLVPLGNPRHLVSYRQAAKQDDIKVAVISGAVEEIILKTAGMSETQLIPVPDAQTGLVAVESGIACALALSSPTINWMQLHQALGKSEVASPFTQSDDDSEKKLGFGAFAFRKEENKLRSAWNHELNSFIGSAEHQSLIAKFGFSRAELPGAITTAEVLAKP